MQSFLQQWYDIRREDLKCSLVADVELCQYHSVEQALLLNGLIRLEEFSLIKHIPSEMYASASVLSSSLLFPGGKYCYIDGKTGAKVLEKTSCDVFFQAVADELDFDLNLQIDNTQYQYIIASGTSLTTTVRSNVKTKIIGINSLHEDGSIKVRTIVARNDTNHRYSPYH